MQKQKLPEVRVTTYIRATPARLWKALTDPKELRRWYLKPAKLQLRKGGRWDFLKGNLAGRVLQVVRHKKLVHTFRFAFAKGEPDTRVTFLIGKQVNGVTELTLIHDRFGTGKKTRAWVSAGWIFLVSNLKSYLETRKPLKEGGYSGK